jgi:hypothetical protein
MLKNVPRCGWETREGQDAAPVSRFVPGINPIHRFTALSAGSSDIRLWPEESLRGQMIFSDMENLSEKRSGGSIWKRWMAASRSPLEEEIDTLGNPFTNFIAKIDYFG